MSELLNLFPEIAEKHYFQDSETKEFWFHASGVCKVLGFANVARSVQMHTDDDERFQEIYDGRTVWFVSEAGCYSLAMAAKNDVAKKFKRWLKHEVLPKLRASGYYVMPTATSEQLEAAQNEIKRLLDEKEHLLDWSPRLSTQKMRFLDLINYRGKEYSPLLGRPYRKHTNRTTKEELKQFQKLERDADLLFALIDTLCNPGQKISCYYFNYDNPKAIIAHLPYKLFRVLTLPYKGNQLYPIVRDLAESVELKTNYYELWLEYVPEKREALEGFLNLPTYADTFDYSAKMLESL